MADRLVMVKLNEIIGIGGGQISTGKKGETDMTCQIFAALTPVELVENRREF